MLKHKVGVPCHIVKKTAFCVLSTGVFKQLFPLLCGSSTTKVIIVIELSRTKVDVGVVMVKGEERVKV